MPKKKTILLCRSTLVTGTTSALRTHTTNKSIIESLTTTASSENSKVENKSEEENKVKVEGATSLKLLSLMVWGSPGSFGTADKELRISAIGLKF